MEIEEYKEIMCPNCNCREKDCDENIEQADITTLGSFKPCFLTSCRKYSPINTNGKRIF